MKRKINKIVSLILVFCIMVSLVTVTGISANAATNDEVVSSDSSENFKYRVTAGEGAKILGYYGTDTELVIPSIIDGYTVTSIGEDNDGMALDYNLPITSVPITSVTIPDTVTKIGARAFMGCKKLTSVNIPDSVITIESEAFKGCYSLYYLAIGKNVKTIGYNAFDGSFLRKIYIPKSVTSIDKTAFPYGTIFTDIYYEGSEEDWEKVCGYNYTTAYWFNLHYNCPQDPLIGNSTIESDDFALTLYSKGETKEFGEIALPAGTYEFNVRKGDVFNVLNGKNVLGYNRVINDSAVGGLTCSAKYKSKITLVATGGVYSFQFDKYTNKLIIKRTGDLPDVYLVGDCNAILTPVEGTNLSVGSAYLYNDTHRFRISKNGTILKKETVNAFTNTTKDTQISLSEEYTHDVWFVAYGGMYTFIFNRETNQLSIKYVNEKRDLGSTDTIHVTGKDFNLDLDDNNGESDIATGTITLKKGAYSFKLYNRGVACGSNSIYFDKGTRTLSPNFMLPSVLYASGGKYKFNFEKSTGRLFIHRA